MQDKNKEILDDVKNDFSKHFDTESGYQMNMFGKVDESATEIKKLILSLDMNTMTPIECMLKLSAFKKQLEE